MQWIIRVSVHIFSSEVVFHRYHHTDTDTRLNIHTDTRLMIHTDTDTGIHTDTDTYTDADTDIRTIPILELIPILIQSHRNGFVFKICVLISVFRSKKHLKI